MTIANNLVCPICHLRMLTTSASSITPGVDAYLCKRNQTTKLIAQIIRYFHYLLQKISSL